MDVVVYSVVSYRLGRYYRCTQPMHEWPASALSVSVSYSAGRGEAVGP